MIKAIASNPETARIQGIVMNLMLNSCSSFLSTTVALEELNSLENPDDILNKENIQKLQSVILDPEVQQYKENVLGQKVAAIVFDDKTGLREYNAKDSDDILCDEIVNLKGKRYDYKFIESILVSTAKDTVLPRPIKVNDEIKELWGKDLNINPEMRGAYVLGNLYKLRGTGLAEKDNDSTWYFNNEFVNLHRYFLKDTSLL